MAPFLTEYTCMFSEQPSEAHRDGTPSYLPCSRSCQSPFKFFPAIFPQPPHSFPPTDFSVHRCLCLKSLLPSWLCSECLYTSCRTQLSVTFRVESFQMPPGKNNCSLHSFPAGFFKPLLVCKFNYLGSVSLPLYIMISLRLEAKTAYTSVFLQILTQSLVQSRK